MPPKPTTATWPPSRNRATARKSVHPVSSTAIFTPYEEQQSTPTNHSPNTNTTTTTTGPILDNKTRVKKTLDTDSGLATCINRANTEQQQPFQPDNDADVAGTGKGTRKVIRKTVRVVKRVIKRKVPKNVSENRDLVEEEDTDNVGNFVTDSDVIEKPNVVMQDELKETSLVSNKLGVSEQISDDDAGRQEESEKVAVEDNVGAHVVEQVARDDKSDEVDMEIETVGFTDQELQFGIKSSMGSEMTEDVIEKSKLATENFNIQDEELKETTPIRKTVRVVKRVIKRKVPKNVSENRDEDNVGNSVTDSDVIEKPNVVFQDELKETSLVSNKLGVSEQIGDDDAGGLEESEKLAVEDNVGSHVVEQGARDEKSDEVDMEIETASFPDKELQFGTKSCMESEMAEDVIEKPKLVTESFNIQDEELKETPKIRKTVRVVKRVIKRKVPKNVSKNRDEDNIGNSVTDCDVIEKPNVIIQDESKATSLVSDKLGVSEQIVDDISDDEAGGPEETEKRALEDTVMSNVVEKVIGDEKSDEVDMEIETACFPAKELQFGTKSSMESEMAEDLIEKHKFVTENFSFQDEEFKETTQISIEEGVLEPLVDERVDDRSPIMNVDETNGSIVEEADRNDVNVSFTDTVEEEKYVVLVEEKDGSHEKPESDENLVENHSVECNEGLLLSDELEALERKKRRKTEIFVGGLEKDVREDDIRKAFEEAGAVVDVDLVMNSRKAGKNKGFAFVRFSTAAEANTALTKYSRVKICGKQSHVQPVQGNDTLFLGNIDRCWKTEDVMQLLEKAGVDKIDTVSIKADPRNIERNRGFAFLEFETNRAAQNAFYKLQNKNVFGKNTKVRVAWAEPLIEPAEEEILKVKSVYAEFLPSSWNVEKVKEYFKRFGEIENVAHAKDLTSSRRNDFAFINYKTREAALACIEAVRKERLHEDDGSKVKMAVSLAKPISMRKQMKHDTSATMKQLSRDTSKISTATVKLHEPSSSYNHGRGNTTDELVHLLRRQASDNHIPPRGITGPFMPENHLPLHGDKRPFPFAGHDPVYMESRGIPRARFDYSNPIPGPSYLPPHGHERAPFPYHHQPGHGLTFESVHGRNVYPRHFPTRERSLPPYYGNSNIYRRH